MIVGWSAGAWIIQRFASDRMLALFAAGALAATFIHGPAAMYALIVVRLFHSIMFPKIFAEAICGHGPLKEESGLLIMSIAGGILVFIQGNLADHYGIQ